MRAMVRRLRHSVGVRGAIFLLVPVVLIGLIVAAGGDAVHHLGPLTAPVMVVVLIAGASIGYRRSGRVPEHTAVLGPDGVPNGRFCLVLRPFGADGELILARTWKSGKLAANYWFTYTRTVEQVITRAVREAVDLDTYAVVDQRVRLAPPGPTFLRVPDEQWQEVAGRLITHASAILLVLPPDRDPGAGFGWELDEISRLRDGPPVLLVLAPGERNRRAAVPAADEVRRAGTILDRLDPTAPAGHRIDQGAIVVRHVPGGAPLWWGAEALPRPTMGLPLPDVADCTYHAAIGAALGERR